MGSRFFDKEAVSTRLIASASIRVEYANWKTKEFQAIESNRIN